MNPMKMQQKGTLLACCLGTLLAAPAWADVVVDPDSLGLTAVYPSNIPGGTGTIDYLFVGHSGVDGSLEVNADALVNGMTSIRILYSAQIGAGLATGSGAGTLRVIGDGGLGSASVYDDGSFAVGIGGDGLVEIRDGGIVSAKSVQVGSSGTVDADILVTGPNSTLESTGGEIGFSGDAIGNSRSIMVSGGGWLNAMGIYDGVFTPGAEYAPGDIAVNQGDQLIITGPNSSAGFEMHVWNRGLIEVTDGSVLYQSEPADVIDSFTSLPDPRGFMSMQVGALDTTALLHVGGGGWVDLSRNMRIGGFVQSYFVPDGNGGWQLVEAGTSGQVVVDSGGVLNVTGDIVVSENGTPGGDGVLTVVNGGEVDASNIIVNEGGLLNGDGGFLYANVQVDGGTIAPGNSPGTLTIYGDLEILNGTLDIEIGATDQDVLDVLGNVTLGGGATINLHFIDGFAPSQGDTFSFLYASSVTGINGATINLFGLQDGFQFVLSTTGGMTLIAMNDAVSAVPVPAAVWLFGSGLLGLVGVARRKPA